MLAYCQTINHNQVQQYFPYIFSLGAQDVYSCQLWAQRANPWWPSFSNNAKGLGEASQKGGGNTSAHGVPYNKHNNPVFTTYSLTSNEDKVLIESFMIFRIFVFKILLVWIALASARRGMHRSWNLVALQLKSAWSEMLSMFPGRRILLVVLRNYGKSWILLIFFQEDWRHRLVD